MGTSRSAPTETHAPSPGDSPGTAPGSPDSPGWATLGWGFGFALLCLMMIANGLERAYHFVGPAIDGPFQLYNSLRRIWVGQHPGVDFQFFHGLGVPYLHYIPFRLLGGGFFASEIVRESLSAILYPITIVAVIRFFVRDWTRTMAWATIVMAMSIALLMTSMLGAVNSLLGVRSTLPTLLPIALCLRVRPWIRTTLAGALLGESLVMGTEQGLAAGLAIVIATVVYAWRSPAELRLRRVADGAAILALGAVTLVVTLILLGGVAGMRGALNYNFRLVPMDQYWYFGAPPNVFLSSWGAIPGMFAAMLKVPITLLVGVAIASAQVRLLWRDAAKAGAPERMALTVLALYGVISCASLLGTYVKVYVQPLLRVDLLLAAILLDRRLIAFDLQRGRRSMLGLPRSIAVAAGASIAIMLVVVPRTVGTILSTLPHVLVDHVIGGVGPGYSGIWPETISDGQRILDSKRDANGNPPVLWSTYSGLLEARNGLFNPEVDYIIHALGPAARAKYVDDFKRIRPGLVQTVSPLYTQYESWIEETSWDFYAELLQNYELVGDTPWSLFWERHDAIASPPLPVWSARIQPGSEGVQLPSLPAAGADATVALYQVELEYHVLNPLHALPIVGGSPRYLVRALNALQREPVTLDPYLTTARFPLIVPAGAAPQLQWAVYSLLPGASIDVTQVRISLVHVAPKNMRWLLALAAPQQSSVAQ